MQKEDTVRICSDHKHYPVPLLFTWAFKNYEWWCPYCGDKYEKIRILKEVPKTEELTARHRWYLEATQHYLNAVSMQIAKKILRNEQYISPDELPENEKEHYAAIREKGWKLFVKAEH